MLRFVKAGGRLRTSLRVRISATIAIIVVVAVAVLTIGVHLIMVQSRISEQRSSADQQVQSALAIYHSTGLLGFDAEINDSHLPHELREKVDRDGSRATLVTGGGTRQLWAAARTKGKILSIHRSFRPVNSRVATLDRALLMTGGATVVAAMTAGALSAGGLSRRLRRAGRTAQQVQTDHDHQSIRAAAGPGNDEVGDLADAVDGMADRLAERIQSEQRFTADVAHDLRTPLTGLINAADLLEDSRAGQMVRERAAAMASLVEELLEVARLDAGLETAELAHAHISELVGRVIKRGVDKGEFPRGEIRTSTTGASATVLTDPRRLERVISNLVRNALQHGEPPIEVDSTGATISITDHGSGFSRDLLKHGPQRFRQASAPRGKGHGLGLVIAAGQTAVLSGTLQLENVAGKGARVTVHLPQEAVTHKERRTGT